MGALKTRLDRIEAMLAEIRSGVPNSDKNELERIRSNDLTDFEKHYIEGIEDDREKCFALRFAQGYPEFCDKWGYDFPTETPERKRHRILVMKQLKLRGADCYQPSRADLEAAEAAAREEEEAEAKLAQGNPKPPSR